MFALTTSHFEVLESIFSKLTGQLMLIRTKFLKLTFSTWHTNACSNQQYKHYKSVKYLQS